MNGGASDFLVPVQPLGPILQVLRPADWLCREVKGSLATGKATGRKEGRGGSGMQEGPPVGARQGLPLPLFSPCQAGTATTHPLPPCESLACCSPHPAPLPLSSAPRCSQPRLVPDSCSRCVKALWLSSP